MKRADYYLRGKVGLPLCPFEKTRDPRVHVDGGPGPDDRIEVSVVRKHHPFVVTARVVLLQPAQGPERAGPVRASGSLSRCDSQFCRTGNRPARARRPCVQGKRLLPRQDLRIAYITLLMPAMEFALVSRVNGFGLTSSGLMHRRSRVRIDHGRRSVRGPDLPITHARRSSIIGPAKTTAPAWDSSRGWCRAAKRTR
jgi:hypothetical protein